MRLGGNTWPGSGNAPVWWLGTTTGTTTSNVTLWPPCDWHDQAHRERSGPPKPKTNVEWLP
jgi:hypothetical protein